MSEVVVAAKPSIESEFLTAFAAEVKPPEVVTEKPVEVKTEGDAVVAEPAKVETKPETPSLTRRLATLAAAEKRAKDSADQRKKDDDARSAREAELKPAIDRILKAKTAASKMEAARLALDLDDDGMAELFLELHRHNSEAGNEKKDPLADLDAKLEAKLDAALKARDKKAQDDHDARLESMRAAHVTDVLETLDVRGDDFPLVAIAPPSQVDITAISEAWLVANGEIPGPEEVLKLFQDQRQTNLDARRTAAEAKKSSKTAPEAKADGEASGSKAKPIRRDDVPVSSPRKLSIEESFLQAYRAATGA